MNSFTALHIEKADGQIVSGFVHPDESWFDFRNVARCAVYSRFVESGMA